MSGDVDYLLRVAVPDIAAYDTFYRKLISRVEIARVSSAFAMEEIKHTTACRSSSRVLERWQMTALARFPRGEGGKRDQRLDDQVKAAEREISFL